MHAYSLSFKVYATELHRACPRLCCKCGGISERFRRILECSVLAGTTRLVADSAEAESVAAAAEEEQNEDDAGAVIASATPVTAEAAEAVAATTAKQQDDYDPPTTIIVTASSEESTHFISSFYWLSCRSTIP
ncbi:MAG: hypothetical protein ACOX8O_06065 [Christensenellales bacterium]